MASALLSAMASLILNACDGLGGGISFSNSLGFVGVAGLPVLFVRIRTGLLAVAILDFPGVDGGLRDGLVDDCWGILDISIIQGLRNYMNEDREIKSLKRRVGKSSSSKLGPKSH